MIIMQQEIPAGEFFFSMETVRRVNVNSQLWFDGKAIGFRHWSIILYIAKASFKDLVIHNFQVNSSLKDDT